MGHDEMIAGSDCARRADFMVGGNRLDGRVAACPDDPLMEAMRGIELAIGSAPWQAQPACSELLRRLERIQRAFKETCQRERSPEGMLGTVDQKRPELARRAAAIRQRQDALERELEATEAMLRCCIESHLLALRRVCAEVAVTVEAVRSCEDAATKLVLDTYMVDVGVGD